ncbi:MAG: hypothetical protein ABI949_11880 [Ilumatobacteraceae bacterium]
MRCELFVKYVHGDGGTEDMDQENCSLHAIAAELLEVRALIAGSTMGIDAVPVIPGISG